MIILKDVIKQFKHEEPLWKIDQLTIPDTGLVLIHGASGSGKSTLLHLIGGLDLDYRGDILLDNINLKALSPNDRDDYRFKTVGFVMQQYHLLEGTTILANLTLPLLALGNNKQTAATKAKQILKEVGLNKNLKQKVATLSGGEKQRLSLGRALITKPKYLLCDEPTGALDEENRKIVYNILKKVSENTLVLLVSHDVSAVINEADMVIKLHEGSFDVVKDAPQTLKQNVKVAGNETPKLPLSFGIRYNFGQLRGTPFRALITNLVTSLGLLGIGLSFVLTNAVNTRLKESLTSISDPNAIVMKAKAQSNETKYLSARYEEVRAIKNAFPNYFSDIGVMYDYNFENNLPDGNYVYIANTGQKIILPSFHLRQFSEFTLIDEIPLETIYPQKPLSLTSEEIILGLPFQDLDRIRASRYLPVSSSYSDIGQSLLEDPLLIAFYVANYSWQYEDERLFLVRGFFPSTEPMIVHTNPLFNEILFEEEMRLLSTLDLIKPVAVPWTLKKSYYLIAEEDIYEIQKHFLHEIMLSRYLLSRPLKSAYPHFQVTNPLTNRLIVYDSINAYSHAYVDKVLSSTKEVTSYFAYSDSIYLAEPDLLINGFRNPLLISGDESSLINTLEGATSVRNINEDFNLMLPSNIIKGHYALTGGDALRYVSLENSDHVSGKVPNKINEIVITRKLYQKLFNRSEFTPQILHLAFQTNSIVIAQNSIKDVYEIASLNLVGLIDKPYYALCHRGDWLNLFFANNFELSPFSLQTTGFILNVKTAKLEELLQSLNYQFPQFEFSAPMNEALQNMKKSLNEIKNGMLIITSFALVISLLLIILINYLTIKERLHEVGLLGLIGFRGVERAKLFIINGLLLSFLAFLNASFMLVITEIVLNKAFVKLGFAASSFALNVPSFFAMLLVAIVIGFLASYLSTNKLNKVDVLPLLYR